MTGIELVAYGILSGSVFAGGVVATGITYIKERKKSKELIASGKTEMAGIYYQKVEEPEKPEVVEKSEGLTASEIYIQNQMEMLKYRELRDRHDALRNYNNSVRRMKYVSRKEKLFDSDLFDSSESPSEDLSEDSLDDYEPARRSRRHRPARPEATQHLGKKFFAESLESILGSPSTYEDYINQGRKAGVIKDGVIAGIDGFIPAFFVESVGDIPPGYLAPDATIFVVRPIANNPHRVTLGMIDGNGNAVSGSSGSEVFYVAISGEWVTMHPNDHKANQAKESLKRFRDEKAMINMHVFWAHHAYESINHGVGLFYPDPKDGVRFNGFARGTHGYNCTRGKCNDTYRIDQGVKTLANGKQYEQELIKFYLVEYAFDPEAVKTEIDISYNVSYIPLRNAAFVDYYRGMTAHDRAVFVRNLFPLSRQFAEFDYLGENCIGTNGEVSVPFDDTTNTEKAIAKMQYKFVVLMDEMQDEHVLDRERFIDSVTDTAKSINAALDKAKSFRKYKSKLRTLEKRTDDPRQLPRSKRF